VNLNCPKCNSADTQKLSLVMSQGAMTEKGTRLGIAYGINVMLPLVTLLIAALMGIVFALIHALLGLVVFLGTLGVGFMLWKWLRAKTRPQYSDLPADMKANGFRCNRCEHLFLPA
jgi:threonine/homoserine/homoserine lactone efflux protein